MKLYTHTRNRYRNQTELTPKVTNTYDTAKCVLCTALFHELRIRPLRAAEIGPGAIEHILSVLFVSGDA